MSKFMYHDMKTKTVAIILTVVSVILLSFGIFVAGVFPMSFGHWLLILSNIAAYLSGKFFEKKANEDD